MATINVRVSRPVQLGSATFSWARLAAIDVWSISIWQKTNTNSRICLEKSLCLDMLTFLFLYSQEFQFGRRMGSPGGERRGGGVVEILWSSWLAYWLPVPLAVDAVYPLSPVIPSPGIRDRDRRPGEGAPLCLPAGFPPFLGLWQSFRKWRGISSLQQAGLPGTTVDLKLLGPNFPKILKLWNKHFVLLSRN